MEMPTHAGWFDDPADPTQLRYFDGVIWTSHTAPRTTRTAPADVPPAHQDPLRPSQYPSAPQAPQPPVRPGAPLPPQQWQVPTGGQQQPYQQPYQAPSQRPSGQLPGAPQPGGGWGAPTYGGYYNHPGKAVTASTGDNGYQGASFPASRRVAAAMRSIRCPAVWAFT